MRIYNLVLVLTSLLLLRIIAFSGTYADSICLISLLGFLITKEYIELKSAESEIGIKIKQTEEKLQFLAEEITKAKSSSEGLKAVINMTKRG